MNNRNISPINTFPKTALVISAFLLLLCLASLLYLVLPKGAEGNYIADIYQNGILLMSIPLDGTRESEIFTVTGENGCVNDIEIRAHSIGILSADCPDRLCVKQGFIRDSRLPITCLPNRLVIQLRLEEAPDQDLPVPDIITY